MRRLLCLLGFHVWEEHFKAGDAWRHCLECGRYEEGAYDGRDPFWRHR